MANKSLNVPATPQAKLALRLKRARDQGREYNEKTERAAIGLPPVEGRKPILITKDEAKRRNYDSLSNDAIKELEDAASGADASASIEREAKAQEEIRRLRAQVSELTGNEEEIPGPTPSDPNDDGTVDIEGWPRATKEWTRQVIVEWNDQHSLPPVPKRGVGMKKLALLDLVIGHAKEAGIGPEESEGDA